MSIIEKHKTLEKPNQTKPGKITYKPIIEKHKTSEKPNQKKNRGDNFQ